MNLANKLEIAELLYKKGFSISEIADLLGFKQNKQLVIHIRKNKIKQESTEKQSISNFSEESINKLKQFNLLDKIKEILPKVENTEESIEIPEILNIEQFESNKVEITYESEVARYKKLIKLEDKNNICSVCENKGFIYLPKKNSIGLKSHKCPKCGGKAIHNNQAVNIDSDILKEFIPNLKYREIDFNLDTLRKGADISEELKNKVLFNDYLNLLDNMLIDFKNGKLPKKSYMLSAPDGFGKKYFVYQAIKECLSYDYNVSVLIDILEIQELFNNFRFKELLELLDSEMLFIDLSGGTKLVLTDTFRYILNHCENKGIPVIFISRTEKATIIQQKGKQNIVDWCDIFKENTFDYDFGHLENIGITGFFARDIYQNKQKDIQNFIKYSPMKMKGNSIVNTEELVDFVTKNPEELLINKNDFVVEKVERTKTLLEIESGIDM
ncbi:hypothetical protein ACFJZE_13460 [Enterococcus faecalis]|uniref:hypothetical protein n=1 Tax=Enterococcus faecalis TaxID=1351 RepID=UPI000CF0AA51|nr:hypothetical protein [Enterococcus faecalis]PQC21215.1 hypothetical protein CUM99_15360 [Enterococcus faecalis]